MIVDIRAGEGGKDSALFAKDLASAYLKYGMKASVKSEIIGETESTITLEFGD